MPFVLSKSRILRILRPNKLGLKLFLIALLGLTAVGLVVFFLKFNREKAPTEIQNPLATGSAQLDEEKPVEPPKLSLETIFATASASLSGLDESKIIKLIATGDVIPARGANWPAVQSGDFKFPWRKTASLLQSGDLTLINLEAPLFAGCQLQTSGFTFCGDARHIEGIVWAGVDVASLANNHIGNYGQEGIEKTISLLTKNNVDYSGFDHLAIKGVKGVKFGFLAYNGVGATFQTEGMKTQIAASKKKVDILVVSVHWGMEYESFPKAAPPVAPDDPKQIAKLMIEAGADLIIGNHPHWVQGIQIINNGFVTYAHGNFIFDQTWSEETKEGVVGEYIFYDKKLVSVHLYPTKFEKQYQPRFLKTDEGAHVLKRMKGASVLLAK